MNIPPPIPALRLFTILTAVYFFIWIPQEGNLTSSMALAATLALLSWGHWLQRRQPRWLRPWQWALLLAAGGAYVGLAAAAGALLLMALKTGLHAHGPEFTPAEILWVMQQAPWWGGAGCLAGLGLGFLTANPHPPDV